MYLKSNLIWSVYGHLGSVFNWLGPKGHQEYMYILQILIITHFDYISLFQQTLK